MHYPVMTEKHLADRWQVSLETLRRWRLDGEGPVWHKLFRHVRYHEADVLEFEHSSAQHLMTLLGIKREFKPEVPEAAQGLDAKAEDNDFTATEIAEAASLPIHLFRDQAERNRKRVPHLMLVGNLRFSLPAILEWEMANSAVGSAAAAVSDEAESPAAPSEPAKRWHVRAFDRKSGEFRDFVVTRIEAPTLLDEEPQPHERPDNDIQWTRIVELDFVPHPRLERPEIIERDYGMEGGAIRMRVRAAVAGYMLLCYRVDCSPDHSLKEEQYRLWLADPLSLYGVENAKLAPGYQAPAAKTSRKG